MEVIDKTFASLAAAEFHDLVKLRVDVFVVEQACPYPELDGRDVEPTTRHVWTADTVGPCSYLRVLDDGEARRLGRIVTRADVRGAGMAGALLDHVLATTVGPWVLDAQAHLEGWYTTRGFVATGPEYLEDGIAHVPMRLER